jgi:hypothetical protein
MELHTPGLVENIVVSFVLSLPFLIAIIIIGVLIKIIRSRSSSLKVKRLAGFSLTVIGSIIIVLATLNFPKTINEPNQQSNMTCGWPMPFMVVDGNTPPSYYPWTASCISWGGNIMDTEKEFFWMPFLTNVVLTFSVILAGVLLLMRLSNVKKGVRTNIHAENKHKPD